MVDGRGLLSNWSNELADFVFSFNSQLVCLSTVFHFVSRAFRFMNSFGKLFASCIYHRGMKTFANFSFLISGDEWGFRRGCLLSVRILSDVCQTFIYLFVLEMIFKFKFFSNSKNCKYVCYTKSKGFPKMNKSPLCLSM